MKKLFIQPAIVSSVLVTGLLVGVQRLGMLESFELKVFDQMMQSRVDLGSDPRLLIVGLTEEDIQRLNQNSPSGKVLDKLFSKLERNQARVIGLDFYRDVPVEPGHAQLLRHLQKSDRIIPVCSQTAPPPRGVDINRVGFADLPEDPDGIIRRTLLFIGPEPQSPCQSQTSLAIQLAVKYLADTENIQPSFTPEEDLQLGKTVLKRLQPDSGGYVRADTGGYQILLNYRSLNNVARQVSFRDVLRDKVNPSWVKNKVVLIGATAPSKQDIRNTPYSTGKMNNSGKMPGVVIHAQIVSEILSAVLDKRPLFWFWSEWSEILWIWGWTLVGGLLALRFQHPLRLGIATGVSVIILVGSCFVIFNQSGWIPLAPPLLGLVLATVSVSTYTAYQDKQRNLKIANQIEEQQQTISLLQAMLREGGNAASQPHSLALDSVPAQEKLLNNRYRITQMLASGGFSYTYIAEDTKRPGSPMCVVKHLQPAQSDPRFLTVARRLFQTEAEILEFLGKHNRIPQLLAYFEENQQFYLVQEFIKGHSLQEELCASKRLKTAQVIELLKAVLQMLVFVHKHNVIHRDIKPSNLIRREVDGQIVVIDFGAVKQIQPQRADDNLTVAVGTMGYAPPEQLIGQPRLNSDIYALGMIGIQALTGKPAKEIQRDPDTTALIWRDSIQTMPELAAILDKMTSYDYLKRYQSAEEVLQALERLSVKSQ